MMAMSEQTAAEAERAAEEAPFADAETFGVDASEGTAANDERAHTLGQVTEEQAAVRRTPLDGHLGRLGAMGVYAGSAGLVALIARLARRSVDPPTFWDVLVGAAATHELSKLDARDPQREPSRTGTKHNVGELLTGPSCTRMWVVTGLSAGYALAPRATRLATAGLAVLTGADLLQAARDKLNRG